MLAYINITSRLSCSLFFVYFYLFIAYIRAVLFTSTQQRKYSKYLQYCLSYNREKKIADDEHKFDFFVC